MSPSRMPVKGNVGVAPTAWTAASARTCGLGLAAGAVPPLDGGVVAAGGGSVVVVVTGASW